MKSIHDVEKRWPISEKSGGGLLPAAKRSKLKYFTKLHYDLIWRHKIVFSIVDTN